MNKNVLTVSKKYTNVLDLHGASVSLHGKNNIVDLRLQKKQFDKKLFSETLTKRTHKRPQIHRTFEKRKNFFTVTYKTIALLLIINLSSFSLAQVGSTVSILNDTETSGGNEYVAGVLDFTLNISPFSNDAWTNLTPGTTTARDVDVEPNILSNPFVYYASSTNFVGDRTFCDAINVIATLDEDVMYDGPLTELLSATTTVIDAWNLEFSNNQNFFNSVCQFDIDFNGWQTRHDYPEYHDGYSDTEKTTHTLYSDGLKINKVYFEKEGGGCLCGDLEHDSYGDDGEFHCEGDGGSITIINTNTGSTGNNASSTGGTGGNSATGGGGGGDKVTICHATESEVNPWNRIVVSPNAINGHFLNSGTPKAGHEDDVLLEGNALCPFQKEWVYDEGTFEDLYTHFEISSTTASSSSSGGGGTIITGDASSTAVVTNTINQNYISIGGNKDYEWVELYNPNSEPADIDGWFLCDGESCDVLNSDTPIPPLGFAVIAGDARAWRGWMVPEQFVKIIVDDGEIGNGLDNNNDALFLMRPDYFTFDQVNWGIPDNLWPYFVPELWNPGVAPTTSPSMIARIPTGYDTNQVTDWQTLLRPTVDLLYPGHHVNHPWYWGFTYLITWEATNPNGGDEALLIDLILIQDTNYNRRPDKNDNRLVLKNKIFNDGNEEITVPEGFIGYVWLKIVATGPENPMAHDFDKSGKIYDPIPTFMLDDEEEQVIIEEAVKEQIEGTGDSEYAYMLAEPIEEESVATSSATTTTETEQATSTDTLTEEASTTPEVLIEFVVASTTEEQVPEGQNGTTSATSTDESVFKDEVLELIEEAQGEPEGGEGDTEPGATTTPAIIEEEEYEE